MNRMGSRQVVGHPVTAPIKDTEIFFLQKTTLAEADKRYSPFFPLSICNISFMILNSCWKPKHLALQDVTLREYSVLT